MPTTRLGRTKWGVVPESAAADADVAAHLDADRFGVYDGLGVETEGRLVWAAGEVATAEFDFLVPGGPDDGVHTPN